MSMTELDPQATSLPKERFFWRRFGALLIDFISIAVAAWFIGVIISITVPGQENFFFGTKTHCEPAEAGPLVERISKLAPLPQDQKRFNMYCEIQSLGFQARYFMTSIVKTSENSTFTWSSSAFVDNQGNPIKAPATQYLPYFNFLFFLLTLSIFAWLISKKYNTPGRRLFGINVVTLSNETPSFRSAFVREIGKYIVLLLIAAISIVSYPQDLLGPSFEEYVNGAPVIMDGNFGPMFLIGFVLTMVTLVLWWLGPFVLWKGQTFYDRLLGFKVIRSS